MRELMQHWKMVITIGLLYLSQGIPMGLAFDALPTLLRSNGISLEALAFAPLVGIPWVIKFLWAPVVDNHWLPKLGRRRSWIIPMQVMVVIALLLLSILTVNGQTALAIVLILAVASLMSATQDIATDGLAAEFFQGNMLAKINAIQITGVFSGFFIGGAGSLLLSGILGQSSAFLIMMLFPVMSLLAVIFLLPKDAKLLEMKRAESPTKASLWKMIKRSPAITLLSLAVLSAVTAVSGTGISKLFLNDNGWAIEHIGQLGISGGIITIILGCGGGVILIQKFGLWSTFIIGLISGCLAALIWFVQSHGWAELNITLVVISTLLSSIATGLTSVVMLTVGMAFAAKGEQAGTDITAIQSARDLGELIASSFLIGLVAKIGYDYSFLLGAMLAVIAIILVWRLSRRV